MEFWPISPWIVYATTSGDPLLDFLLQAGAAGVMAFVIIGFLRGWIVTGRELAKAQADKEVIREERDRALELVYKQAELTQRAIDLSSEKRPT